MAPPLVLVMTRFCGARSGNCGIGGGASTWSWPNSASVQLILLNNWAPVSGPFWPSRAWVLTFWAAPIQAARWVCWSARQRAETFLRIRRMFICDGVSGLAGVARIRLTWP